MLTIWWRRRRERSLVGNVNEWPPGPKLIAAVQKHLHKPTILRTPILSIPLKTNLMSSIHCLVLLQQGVYGWARLGIAPEYRLARTVGEPVRLFWRLLVSLAAIRLNGRQWFTCWHL